MTVKTHLENQMKKETYTIIDTRNKKTREPTEKEKNLVNKYKETYEKNGKIINDIEICDINNNNNNYMCFTVRDGDFYIDDDKLIYAKGQKHKIDDEAPNPERKRR